MAGPVLYQLGTVQFTPSPFEVHDVTRHTETNYAAKDLIQAPRPREFMGEGDERLKFTGFLFPFRPISAGGLAQLALLQQERQSGQPQLLIRGGTSGDLIGAGAGSTTVSGSGATIMGYFLIEKIDEHDTYLSAIGIGKFKEIEISLVKSPRPPNAAVLNVVSWASYYATSY